MKGHLGGKTTRKTEGRDSKECEDESVLEQVGRIDKNKRQTGGLEQQRRMKREEDEEGCQDRLGRP